MDATEATEAAVRRVLRWSHPPDVAAAAKVDRSTAYRWKKGGELPPYRVTQLARLFEIERDQAISEPPWVEGAIRRAVGSVREALLDPEITDDEAEHLARLFARAYMAALELGILRLPPGVGAPAVQSGGGRGGAS